ncbi:uncharacterized protein LOC127858131 isoform X1 [Dreissena polymorpha]|uniref:Protein kinase domain-containing protein n=1 Tax=Dreissena polymorpha TaxID=45954 RepID=A0A9D4S6Q0_DREPO|nr:uncharacterized protein LOC127858131 isoform X1 [Dreissena polymorpha]KAH3892635.1 hypothetical protein DPMN_016758 [Dreissena polymorpha]
MLPLDCTYPSLEEIEGTDDLLDFVTIAEENHVDYTGLESVPELKERLVLEYWRRKGRRLHVEISESMARDGKEDKTKRQQLIEMFQKLLQIVQPSDESHNQKFVNDFLSSDGTTDNILEDCNKRIRELGKDEAVLLVAGETNAGKTSFLNLLFGMDILKVSALSCTSLITSVRYGPRQLFKVIYKDQSKPIFETESLDTFHNIAFPRGKEREIDHGVKEARVYLPLDILKGGLVLTDSPGIGENDFLEDYLMEYIAENDILGFIYVIFSDNAGGVQEDRLLQLLKLVMQEQKKNDKALPFDPKAALFVANRFDAVEESAKETVKDHITSKLKSCYPQFDDSKIVFFSAHNAKRDVTAHPDYISDNFRTLLDSLSRLYSYVTERRLRIYYKWIEHVLQRVSHVMKSATTRLALSQRANTERSRRHRHRLEKLQTDTDAVIKELRAEVVVQTKKISQELHRHLQQPMTKMRLTSSWKDGEIPQVTSEIRHASHWLWIKQRVDTAFYDRVYTELEDWSFENNTIDTIEAEIVACIETKLGVLQAEITSSENSLNTTKQSTDSSDSDTRRMSLKRISLKPSLIEIPDKLPVKLAHRIKPIFAFGRKKETMRFEKDPVQWAGRRSEKLLSQLLKNKKQSGKGPLDILLEVLMQRPSDLIDLLEEKIPTIIKANVGLLDKLEELAVDHRRDAYMYEKMLEEIEGLKTVLKHYGEGYVFVNDFKLSEIRIITGQLGDGQSLHKTFRSFSMIKDDEQSIEGPIARDAPHGLWTYLHAGIFQRDGTEKPITIKLYTTASGMSCNQREVAKLRSLLSTDSHLAEFLGIHHTDAIIPAYIFDQRLVSLSKFLNNYDKPDDYVHKVLLETANGLLNLHSMGLVHMEISQHTITVTEKGDVKLTGACVPRKASFPIDGEAKVGNFVYLPHEVLNDELYITSGDVYGFGLLMYELMYDRQAFDVQRSYRIRDFVQDLNPEAMLRLDQDSGGLPGTVVRLVQICVKKLNSERSTINTVLNQLQVIGDDLSKAFRRSVRETSWRPPRKFSGRNMH